MLSMPYFFRSVFSETGVESYPLPSMGPKNGSVRKLMPSMFKIAVAVVMWVTVKLDVIVAATFSGVMLRVVECERRMFGRMEE